MYETYRPTIALGSETPTCEAIFQAWYLGQAGGKAVAEVLFGDYIVGGRLPVTHYKIIDNLPDFEDYKTDGNTYRILDVEPLFSFGHGLIYTTFQYCKPSLSKNLELWDKENYFIKAQPVDYQLMVVGSSRNEELQIMNFRIQ